MCGICGIMGFGPSPEPASQGLIERMTDSMSHRGPDDRGTYLSDRIALGHRRLSIIDLSAAGHQPMENEDGTIILSYNGEVYNFMELREKFQLDAKGHVFKSRTDSEVLIHLYEELGADMVQHLNGLFAIAIWDVKKETLFMARDRYGIKPFFYHEDGAHFRFGSEIKSILADERVERRASMQALHDFLTFNYVPGTQTAFEDIYEIPPGHHMTVRADGSRETHRYWDLHFQPDNSITEQQAVEASLELMNRSLERRMIADVPIGVFLSGGLDSSTLAALMAQKSKDPIHTYAIGFEDQSFNELPYARIMAEAVGANHREVLVTADMVRSMLPKYLSYIDEPYGDGSAIPTYFISELAKGEVVVVLSGEGGDEAFAGYDTHAAYGMYRKARMVPGFVRNGIIKPLVNMLPVSDKKLSFEFKAKRFLGGLDLPPEEAHLWWRIVLTEEEKLGLYSKQVREEFTPERSVRHFQKAFVHSASPDVLSRLMYIDSTIFMPDDLMIKNDRMTMAHSLEARVPFTDFELTAYLAKVPVGLKMKGGRKKHLMKEAMKPYLPDEILNKKKVGLEMPYSGWLKRELNDLVQDYLGRDRLEATGIFNPASVQKLVDDHCANRRDNGRALWGMLNFMMWHELYIS